MWLDRVTIATTNTSWPPSEEQIAGVAVQVIMGSVPTPHMVVDCRPPSSRTGATATYRLLSSLGLERSAPIAASFFGVKSAYNAFESLLQVCVNGGPALAVTAVVSPPTQCYIACCVLADHPMTGDSLLLEDSDLPEWNASEDAFISLLRAAQRRPSAQVQADVTGREIER